MRTTSRGSRSGQSLVEMALLLPMVLLILTGTVDLGRLAYANVSISNAAYVGAQYGSASPDYALDTSGIQNRVIAETTTLHGMTGSNPSVMSTSGTDAYGNQYVSVSVAFNFAPVVSYPLLPATLSFTRTVTMRVQI
ncbi:MAG: pilus assembly protein [Chloroflexi bacterium]|nr:pilus assembly protein [Chloroflexota bacterium]